MRLNSNRVKSVPSSSMNRICTGTTPVAMVGGRRDRRLEVAIENGHQRQTYYGALDIGKGHLPHATIPQGQCTPYGRFYTLPTTTASRAKVIDLLGWGLLSSPTGHARFSTNDSCRSTARRSGKIDCTRLAPYTPQENPVEDLWLKGKTFVRTHAFAHHLF